MENTPAPIRLKEAQDRQARALKKARREIRRLEIEYRRLNEALITRNTELVQAERTIGELKSENGRLTRELTICNVESARARGTINNRNAEIKDLNEMNTFLRNELSDTNQHIVEQAKDLAAKQAVIDHYISRVDTFIIANSQKPADDGASMIED